MAMISLSGFEGGEKRDPVPLPVNSILRRTKFLLTRATGWFRSRGWNLGTPYLNIGRRGVYWRGGNSRRTSNRGSPWSVENMSLRWCSQFGNQERCYERHRPWLMSTSRWGARLELQFFRRTILAATTHKRWGAVIKISVKDTMECLLFSTCAVSKMFLKTSFSTPMVARNPPRLES